MRKIRIACAVGGLVLLAVNAFVCFSPWFSEVLKRAGHGEHVPMYQEIMVPGILFLWAGGGLFALVVPLANHFDFTEGSTDWKQVWARLATAFTIGWFAAFFATEFTTVPRDPLGDPVIGVLMFAWSIAGAICLLQEMPPACADLRGIISMHRVLSTAGLLPCGAYLLRGLKTSLTSLRLGYNGCKAFSISATPVRRALFLMIFSIKSLSLFDGAPPAVEDVTLGIDPGEFVSIVGHSGAGKTTLLKMLFAEVHPTEGSVFLRRAESERPRQRRAASSAPQHRHYFSGFPTSRHQKCL